MRKGILVSFDDAGRTNDQALTILKKLITDGEVTSPFAQDLAAQAPRLSEKQWCWVHFIVKEASERSVETPADFRLPRLYTLLTTVKLERPCIELGAFGVPVKVKLNKGRDACLVIVQDRFVARIRPDGSVTVISGETLNDTALATLVVMEIDPVGAATLNGRVTGQCCFCQRHLETKESVTAGYGPVCADKWGLPWGHTDAESLIEQVRNKIGNLFPQIG
jgi:hypothetical protein